MVNMFLVHYGQTERLLNNPVADAYLRPRAALCCHVVSCLQNHSSWTSMIDRAPAVIAANRPDV
jgi:hypothetical protein